MSNQYPFFNPGGRCARRTVQCSMYERRTLRTGVRRVLSSSVDLCVDGEVAVVRHRSLCSGRLASAAAHVAGIVGNKAATRCRNQRHRISGGANTKAAASRRRTCTTAVYAVPPSCPLPSEAPIHYALHSVMRASAAAARTERKLATSAVRSSPRPPRMKGSTVISAICFMLP